MSNLNDWFAKGMTKEEYILKMEVHQEHLLKVYNEFQLKNDDPPALQAIQLKGYKAVVLTADWCGDAMVNLPIFMRIADEALIETRYLIRDDNLELMDQYLTNGKARSIPIIVLFDKNGQEVGKWGPRAQEAQVLVDELKIRLPEKESPQYEEAFKHFAEEISEKFTKDEALWNDIKNDLIKTISNLK
ncbi:thioredoxin family protein [Metabacillus arenae]|uniref:Thioredoxin family protein n=1 Tax=Metabacillus arenae TaxID=2771434 RepID=A0A926RVD8_9BACI|nr:thioredoxin family protein [Metabacillus arenae]MBD1379578.1 thioredoxin family protein [Metabacillus arenae]